MIASVYRSAEFGDCTNGGISSRYSRLCIINVDGPFSPDAETPAVRAAVSLQTHSNPDTRKLLLELPTQPPSSPKTHWCYCTPPKPYSEFTIDELVRILWLSQEAARRHARFAEDHFPYIVDYIEQRSPWRIVIGTHCFTQPRALFAMRHGDVLTLKCPKCGDTFRAPYEVEQKEQKADSDF
jgi:hypothetical protein